MPKNPRALPHTRHAGNKHPLQTGKRSMRMHHFPRVSWNRAVSSFNFRQPCEVHPYSTELYGKFDSLPKRGVDRYHEDRVSWQSAGKKGTFGGSHSLLVFLFTTSYFILHVKLLIPFIAPRSLARQYSAFTNFPPCTRWFLFSPRTQNS